MSDFQTITVIAPGLLGGSILLALRERMPRVQLKVWARREETRNEIQRQHLADLVTDDLPSAVRDSDLIILCSPIHVMTEIMQSALPFLKPTTLVTDVGSVKGPLHSALAPMLRGKCHWIGSHPMAGSEQSGLHAAKAGLFEGACCIVTPVSESDPGMLQQLIRFWECCGCTVISISPGLHDEYVAQISHLPHLVAALLVNSVSDESLQVAGPGFRDTSRVAAGPPDMWVEILQANRKAVAASMRHFLDEAGRALAILENGECKNLLPLLSNASTKRRKLS